MHKVLGHRPSAQAICDGIKLKLKVSLKIFVISVSAISTFVDTDHFKTPLRLHPPTVNRQIVNRQTVNRQTVNRQTVNSQQSNGTTAETAAAEDTDQDMAPSDEPSTSSCKTLHSNDYDDKRSEEGGQSVQD